MESGAGEHDLGDQNELGIMGEFYSLFLLKSVRVSPFAVLLLLLPSSCFHTLSGRRCETVEETETPQQELGDDVTLFLKGFPSGYRSSGWDAVWGWGLLCSEEVKHSFPLPSCPLIKLITI